MEQEKEFYVIRQLAALLNECLEGANQENSFEVLGIKDGKFVVAFNIVEIPDDNYVGFAGY
jgi:hypothetical protein